MPTQSHKSPGKILLGQDNNALVILFAINALVFVLINFVKIIYFLTDIPIEFFYSQILDWFTLPAAPAALLLKPWTILTHMFTHYSIWQLISTVMWLWAFGYILQDLAGNNKLIPVYLYGGLAGALIFILANNLFPGLEKNSLTTAPMLGGGSAVMAIAVATTTLSPGYRIFPMINGGIPLWVLTILFVLIDFSTLADGNMGISAAHIGGAAVGFIFIKQLQKGNDWGRWMISLVQWLNDLFSPEKNQQQKNFDEKHFFRANRKPYEKIADNTQQKLDEILDKISQHGFSFLTDEEKAFLQRASDEDL
jgi:membrane associated rhomboid family serine protease